MNRSYKRYLKSKKRHPYISAKSDFRDRKLSIDEEKLKHKNTQVCSGGQSWRKLWSFHLWWPFSWTKKGIKFQFSTVILLKSSSKFSRHFQWNLSLSQCSHLILRNLNGYVDQIFKESKSYLSFTGVSLRSPIVMGTATQLKEKELVSK